MAEGEGQAAAAAPPPLPPPLPAPESPAVASAAPMEAVSQALALQQPGGDCHDAARHAAAAAVAAAAAGGHLSVLQQAQQAEGNCISSFPHAAHADGAAASAVAAEAGEGKARGGCAPLCKPGALQDEAACLPPPRSTHEVQLPCSQPAVALASSACGRLVACLTKVCACVCLSACLCVHMCVRVCVRLCAY